MGLYSKVNTVKCGDTGIWGGGGEGGGPKVIELLTREFQVGFEALHGGSTAEVRSAVEPYKQYLRSCNNW